MAHVHTRQRGAADPQVLGPGELVRGPHQQASNGSRNVVIALPRDVVIVVGGRSAQVGRDHIGGSGVVGPELEVGTELVEPGEDLVQVAAIRANGHEGPEQAGDRDDADAE
ncbi:hypothetical protein PG996_007666 [Apiospora saccharicola]|uniref:Uncharacterized protein n=1 Tax=Apiospora saccharicola TaxID=335842 RepID=A0ABR1VEY1_9PEZI